MRRKQGFSLVEVVVAIALMSVLMFGLVATSASSVQLTELAQEKRLALAKADAVLNRLLADKSLPSTYSDSTGDPKKNAAAGGSPVYPADYVLDFVQDLGETFPKELLLPKGSVEFKAYNVNPIVVWTTSRPFVWNEAGVYSVAVTVRWLPAIERRTKATKTFTQGTTVVTVESLYYRNPQ